MKMHRVVHVAFVIISMFALPAFAAELPTLERIKSAGVVKMGYRENSPPFSFKAEGDRQRGYSVELCQRVAADIATHLHLPVLAIHWVKVDAQDRFEALRRGDIDLLCGNTTQTLSRRAEFDFSLLTFVDGAGLLYRAGEQPATLKEMKGQDFVVVAGTTTEQLLDRLISTSKLEARLVRVKDHDAAIAALKDKSAAAYASDRTVLITTALARGKGIPLELATVQFSYEPYGLMMRRDADFRLLVDTTLARLYRSGEIEDILQRWFASIGPMTDAIQAMIQLNALPE